MIILRADTSNEMADWLTSSSYRCMVDLNFEIIMHTNQWCVVSAHIKKWSVNMSSEAIQVLICVFTSNNLPTFSIFL